MLAKIASAWMLAAVLFLPQAYACGAPPALLLTPPDKLLPALRVDAAPYLAAADTYSVQMESCYDAALGPLELAPLVAQADAVAANMAALRLRAEDEVRANEFEFEDLLSSELWRTIEALRVAGVYGQAWGQLAAAVRHISADDKTKALADALTAMQALTFEFKHPVLVQRAMYGLATTQIEAGDVATARATLERLRDSLKRGGAAGFKSAVDDFYAQITAPDYRPPVALFATPEKQAGERDFGGSAGDAGRALALARQAVRETRPAAEIVALLRPAFNSQPETLAAALDLVARDQLLLDAMDYEPGLALRAMEQAFEQQQYGRLQTAWGGVKPFYPYLPVGLKRRVDYQLGVALLNLDALERAITHLQAARQSLSKGAQATRIDKLIALAKLSRDQAPDKATLALARGFKNAKLPSSDTGIAQTGVSQPPPSLDEILALRARVVLARGAAGNKNWAEADKMLTGVGPAAPGYRLFLGMRVRLLAEAIKARRGQGETPAQLSATGRGAMALYRLWLGADCLADCVSGNRLGVHRAAIEIALSATLDSATFGAAWGNFVEENGDVRPLVPRAIAYLITQKDSQRLAAMLEPADDVAAAFILAHWKAHLQNLSETAALQTHYAWLSTGLEDLQGRPQAVLLETLIGFDLARGQTASALTAAEQLASQFPRRPSAWFLRAAALEANQRGVEAARALSSLARRTPADDPVGMGARLGLAAMFITLERGAQACEMRAKIFSRPQAEDNWRLAVDAFPVLSDWQKTVKGACG